MSSLTVSPGCAWKKERDSAGQPQLFNTCPLQMSKTCLFSPRKKKHTHLHTISWWHHTSSVECFKGKKQFASQAHARVCGESKHRQQAEWRLGKETSSVIWPLNKHLPSWADLWPAKAYRLYSLCIHDFWFKYFCVHMENHMTEQLMVEVSSSWFPVCLGQIWAIDHS